MLVAGLSVAVAAAAAPGIQEQETLAPIDYLTLAQGAIPLRIGGAGAAMGAGMTEALGIIDGNPVKRVFVRNAGRDTDTEFFYELPAPTTFSQFAVPEVRETPSPSQTFARSVEVFGSDSGPDGPYELLASVELQTHSARGEVTNIPVVATLSVRWVMLRLTGGLDILTEKSFLEFGEIIGNGSQEQAALIDRFRGVWKDRGVLIELKQDVAVVSGCYDAGGELEGTVSGNILRARGVVPSTGVVSLFVLNVTEDGVLRGVRSTNGAPFSVYTGPTAPEGTLTRCSEIPEPTLGCESVIHGINFDFDSAAIRPDSAPVLEALFEGLESEPAAEILIEGHTSSEGSEGYNLQLSERRAQSVVDDLVQRGLDGGRIRAAGYGESVPIAKNDTESGRSLNRRVEVRCNSEG